MQVPILPAARGARWLVEGFAIFRRKPALLCFLMLGYLLSMAVILSVPYVGRPASLVLVPAFSVSLMNACRLIDRKEAPLPNVLFSGFYRNPRPLLILGLIHFACWLAVFGFVTIFDGGVLFRLFMLGEAQLLETFDQPAVLISRQITLVLFIPVLLAFWFAPVLAAWHDMSAGKSLFFSLVAGLRNWRPFLLYALIVGLAGFVFLGFVGTLAASEAADRMLPTALTLAASLALFSTLYASFYVSYRDVFAGRPGSP
ncbi:MAG: hypothetical protein LBS70_10815 [Candidatus Accumulibacter sp.]|jgi:hypothetical protein|nr:hypothetical protein [Accumulibacter sp.]